MRQMRIPFLILILLASTWLSACGHRLATSSPDRESPPRLVELRLVIPELLLDIRYATTNNFTGKVIYPSNRCFLAEPAAWALAQVQQDLQKQGYQLIVFDGYRPLRVQKIFWRIRPDSRYVGNPAQGSKHNRGYAVDVSLADRQGNSLVMPTGYDDFSEKAAVDYPRVSPVAARHRRILSQAMARHGFAEYAFEWWHFDYPGWEGQPNLDLPFDQIAPARARQLNPKQPSDPKK